jgi:hypothetical protein
MGLFNRNKNGNTGNKAGTISRLLDDLTHLEINTIIKSGMTAAPPPDSIEETLQLLFCEYKERMVIILSTNDIDAEDRFDFDKCKSFEQLHTMLKDLRRYMDEKDIRILRMTSFCEYMFSKSQGKTAEGSKTNIITVRPSSGEKLSNSLYDLNLSDITAFTLGMDIRDKVKIKRLFDLGSENVVMQTRFGLDGDVVTRVEENFALRPRQLVIDIHEKHTNLTVNYWKNLVGLVQEIVTKIID